MEGQEAMQISVLNQELDSEMLTRLEMASMQLTKGLEILKIVGVIYLL